MLVELDAVGKLCVLVVRGWGKWCVCVGQVACVWGKWCVWGASGVCGGQVACVGGKWRVVGGKWCFTWGKWCVWVEQVECHLFSCCIDFLR